MINWFTVIAQVFNFLILVWLLKRYLYKPILNAIEEREKKIDTQLQEAESKMAEAKKEQEDFREKNKTFEQQRKELMKKAVEAAEAERIRLLDEARKEFITLQSKQENILKDEREKIGLKIVRKTQLEVFAIARKTLLDLASLSLEESIVKVFIKHLNEEEEKKQLIKAFQSSYDPIIVQSAFDLPLIRQSEIGNAIKNVIGENARFQFKKMPELVSGLELITNGYKLTWNISEYLDSIEKNIAGNNKEKFNEE